MDSQFLQSRDMAYDLHPNLLTGLSVLALKIGHLNLLFSVDLIGLRLNSSLICYFPEIISILEKICPNIPNKLPIFNLSMTHKA